MTEAITEFRLEHEEPDEEDGDMDEANLIASGDFGRCSECGKVTNLANMFHHSYDDPRAQPDEFCPSCAVELGYVQDSIEQRDTGELDELSTPEVYPKVRAWQRTTNAAPVLGVPEPSVFQVGEEHLWFRVGTPSAVVDKLLHAHRGDYRIRLCYGDSKTGRDWQEIHDIEGYVGRTTGEVKIPILVYNKRSLGGSAILTDCIVRITLTGKHPTVLWQHPLYHIPPPPDEEQPDQRIIAVLQELQVKL